MQLKNHGNGGPRQDGDRRGAHRAGWARRPLLLSAPNFLTLWSTPFAPDLRNRWLRFLLHVRFDFDSDGFVALYGDLDGRGTVVLMPHPYADDEAKRRRPPPQPRAPRSTATRTSARLASGSTAASSPTRGRPPRPCGLPRAAAGDRTARAPTDSRRPAPPPIAAPGTCVACPQSQGHPRPAVAGRRRRSHGRARELRRAVPPSRPFTHAHGREKVRIGRRDVVGRAPPAASGGVERTPACRGLPRDPAENAGRKSRSNEACSRRGRSRRQQTVRRRELTLR